MMGIIDHEIILVTCKNYMNEFVMKCTCEFLVLGQTNLIVCVTGFFGLQSDPAGW